MMIRIPTILVPVDFSEPSKKAVNYAMSFALEFGSHLILAHVAPFDAAAHEKARADLLALIPTDVREQLHYEFIVKSGDVRAELLGIVEDRDVQLVVMGTHGRSAIGHLFVGSTTEKMLRNLHVPVLTVSHLDPSHDLNAPAPVPIRRILFATDLEEGSEESVTFAIKLAKAFDASLTVAHAFTPAGGAFYGLETAGITPEYVSDVRTDVEERLNRMTALFSDGSVPVMTVVIDGTPNEKINVLAHQDKADLVIINLRAKGRLERALLGATAEHVIRTATVPVLSLPLPATYAPRWIAA
jgi:nucleotide-binding universal stress UspA family protein